MREIKFRAWRPFPQGEMYYFSLEDLIFNSFNKQPLIDYSGIREGIEQYTGLKDKNGKEIYEGDIIHIESWHGRVAIRWSIKMAVFNIPWPITDAKVIGNIHENPELL